METKTYHSRDGFGKTGETVREFGERQNALNARLTERIHTLKEENGRLEERLAELIGRVEELEEKIELLQATQTQNSRQIGKCAADIDRLRLDTKLNTNAIDRLSK